MNVPEPPQTNAHASLSAVRRRRWWVSLLLSLVIFGSGAIVGGSATAWMIRKYARENILHPEKARQRLLSWMRWELELTDRQTAEVAEILRARQAVIMELRRDVQPKVETQLDLLEQEVAEVLDAEQLAKWRARVARLRKQWIPPLPPAGRHPPSRDP